MGFKTTSPSPLGKDRCKNDSTFLHKNKAVFLWSFSPRFCTSLRSTQTVRVRDGNSALSIFPRLLLFTSPPPHSFAPLGVQGSFLHRNKLPAWISLPHSKVSMHLCGWTVTWASLMLHVQIEQEVLNGPGHQTVS